MSKTGFVLISYPMSLEDPEAGTPPFAEAVSDDKQKLIEYVKGKLATDFAEHEIVEEGETTVVRANFDEGDELSTYWTIDSITFL